MWVHLVIDMRAQCIWFHVCHLVLISLCMHASHPSHVLCLCLCESMCVCGVVNMSCVDSVCEWWSGAIASRNYVVCIGFKTLSPSFISSLIFTWSFPVLKCPWFRIFCGDCGDRYLLFLTLFERCYIFTKQWNKYCFVNIFLPLKSLFYFIQIGHTFLWRGVYLFLFLVP